MTLSGKSRTIVLTGVLVLVVAVALPLLPAFGEGGARQDVVRHAAESNAATMDTPIWSSSRRPRQELQRAASRRSSDSTNSSSRRSKV